jgi:hypothetical protein
MRKDGIRQGAPLCRIGSDTAEDPSFILWGDSHARALIPAVAEAAGQEGRSGLFAGHVGCPPLLGVVKSHLTDRVSRTGCTDFNDEVMRRVLADPGIERVILAARWTVNFEGERLPTDHHFPSKIFLYDDQTTVVGTLANRFAFERGLERTLATLVAAGREVTIVGPVPEAPLRVSEALARSVLIGVERDLMLERGPIDRRMRETVAVLNDAGLRYGVRVLFPHQILCDRVNCIVEQGGWPLYFDEDHLSSFGAAYVSALLAERAGTRSAFF